MISERGRLAHPRVFKGVFSGVFAVSFYSPTICEFLWRVLQYANHMAVFGQFGMTTHLMEAVCQYRTLIQHFLPWNHMYFLSEATAELMHIARV